MNKPSLNNKRISISTGLGGLTTYRGQSQEGCKTVPRATVVSKRLIYPIYPVLAEKARCVTYQ